SPLFSPVHANKPSTPAHRPCLALAIGPAAARLPAQQAPQPIGSLRELPLPKRTTPKRWKSSDWGWLTSTIPSFPMWAAGFQICPPSTAIWLSTTK
ncbi:MAG TPA: hypothetical protein VF690_02600, partial [Hymenobacter sp.]